MMCYVCEPNDSISVSSDFFKNLKMSADTCLCQTNNATTNWADIVIAKWIILAIVIIVAIGVIGYILIKLMDIISSYCATKQKREWEIEDKTNKQYAELLNMKLEWLKSKGEKSNKEEYLSAIKNAMDEIKTK